MHVMMAIHAICRSTIESFVLLQLCLYNIFIRGSSEGMIKHRGEPVRTQQFGVPFLVLLQPRWTMPARKRQREVQMKPRIDSVMARKIRRSLGILQEPQRAHS